MSDKPVDIDCGLTKDDVPAFPTVEALAPSCPTHPNAPFLTGFGYAGGGFGGYKKCTICGVVFGKEMGSDRVVAKVGTTNASFLLPRTIKARKKM